MKVPLFSGKDAAQHSLANALDLSTTQRQALARDPNKFIDDNFGDECCGETRALLNGSADRAFWWVLKVLVVLIAVFGCIFCAFVLL
jgi:hypothetical protein